MFSREMALALSDLGHVVRPFGKMDKPGPLRDRRIAEANDLPGPVRTAAFAGSCLAAIARERPDYVISTHVNFGPVALLAKRMFGTPFTLVAHGIDIHSRLPRMTLAALRYADRVVAVSQWTRARVLSLGGIDASRVVIVPNTFNELNFGVAPPAEYLSKRYELEPDDKVVLTVARLDPGERYKGYDRILEALPSLLAECGKVRFIVAGQGGDRQRAEGIAAELGVSQAVTFAGFVPDAELADHYRLADAFAMPSVGEGFGIVFLEAMACGTPVLAGNRDGSVDALDGGRLGKLVNPDDAAEIADGIAQLLHRRGPDLWFDRQALHEAVVDRFGRAAFRETLRGVLSGLPPRVLPA